MIKAAAYLILAAVLLGALAGVALDTFLGDMTWLFLATALFIIDAGWKWGVKLGHQRRAARDRARQQ